MKERASQLGKSIAGLAAHLGRPIKLMEVCGTHTVAIFRSGVRSLLPESISLLSGPGCPVCVTSMKDVDIALMLSGLPDVVYTTFGDMMRVPGSERNLSEAKAMGADVRVVYGPMDALKLAQQTPNKKVVFFATGFETTSPLVAATVKQAADMAVDNFFVQSVHKLVPPALEALLGAGDVQLDGFILPGHVCAIAGTNPYEFLATDHGLPAVATGFEAMDILEGILMLMAQLAKGRAAVEIQYAKVVKAGGNPTAQATIAEVFEPCDSYWRGIGSIPGSGLKLRAAFEKFDALVQFDHSVGHVPESPEPRGCSCGLVLKGIKIPPECPLFGKTCTPQKPVGACMVSAEGSCAAYYKYGDYLKS